MIDDWQQTDEDCPRTPTFAYVCFAILVLLLAMAIGGLWAMVENAIC